MFRENLDDNKKAESKKSDKERIQLFRENLDDEMEDFTRNNDKVRKNSACDNFQRQRDRMFYTAKHISMSDHNILKTPGFKSALNEYLSEISEGPTYVCNICRKLEYRTNVQHYVDDEYDKELFNK